MGAYHQQTHKAALPNFPKCTSRRGAGGRASLIEWERGGWTVHRVNLISRAFLLCVMPLAFASTANALSRTYVSMSGSDGGACSFGAPCRTFAYAVTQTTA